MSSELALIYCIQHTGAKCSQGGQRTVEDWEEPGYMAGSPPSQTRLIRVTSAAGRENVREMRDEQKIVVTTTVSVRCKNKKVAMISLLYAQGKRELYSGQTE